MREDHITDGRIRVVFSIDNMQIGGTELNAVRTAERLDRSRYDLRVACLQDHGPLIDRYQAAGIPVHPFPIPTLYGLEAIRQGVRLASFLRKHRVQIVHSHDAYSNVFAVPWARAAGARVIASRRWWDGLPGKTRRASAWLAYRFADVALANSPSVADLLKRAEALPQRKIAVVPNFVDEEAFQCMETEERHHLLGALGIADTDRIVGIVANLHPIKDHATLLKAASLLRPRWLDLRVILVGDGECRSQLARLAEDSGLKDTMCFAGSRPNQPNPHFLFDVSVLCSVSEGLPNSILEAMAAGRPVVATDVGATADAVVHGETGLLIPPGDPERLAAALNRLLADPVAARAMGEAGRRRARERFSPAAAIAALERLYDDLVDSRAARPETVPALAAPFPQDA